MVLKQAFGFAGEAWLGGRIRGFSFSLVCIGPDGRERRIPLPPRRGDERAIIQVVEHWTGVPVVAASLRRNPRRYLAERPPNQAASTVGPNTDPHFAWKTAK